MPPSTQRRVLDASSELFNRYGIEAVSIGQIAEALKISPGNLTYHYKRKSDLIAAHIAMFEERLQESLDTLPVYSNVKVFCNAFVEFLSLSLRYRFLFIGANYILQNDLVLPDRYRKLVEVTKRNFSRRIKRLTAEGYMSPVTAPYSIDMLAESTWWQWMGWLLAMQVTPPAKREPERKLAADAVLHILFLSHHYVDQEFFRSVQQELKRIAA